MTRTYTWPRLRALRQHLAAAQRPSQEEWQALFEDWSALPQTDRAYWQQDLAQEARSCCDQHYGRGVFLRGLIEYSSYCENDCYYCGLRRSNSQAQRYRLDSEEVLAAAQLAWDLGLRTIVLQGGENRRDDHVLPDLVAQLRARFPEMAITLSLGEKSPEVYAQLRAAGADRYLLRHETALESHYRRLHPEGMELQRRLDCLAELKRLGFQTGAGFMVGSPGQSPYSLSLDFCLLGSLRPEMVGIGPFLPQSQTPFAGEKAGSSLDCLFYLSLTRLLLPTALIPSTTALATASADGRIRGLDAGANVIMPNFTPSQERKKYLLYDGKVNTGLESAEGLRALEAQLLEAGYSVSMQRGDALGHGQNLL